MSGKSTMGNGADEATPPGEIPQAQPVDLAALVAYEAGSVVSRTLAKSAAGTMTVFAFDAGQELSEHTTPFDAFAQVLDGEVELDIGEERLRAVGGELVRMPAKVPHTVRAPIRFKMLLTMIRDRPAAAKPQD